MIDFVGRRRLFFFISAVVILVSIISLAAFKLEPGIDFTGGTSMTLRFTPQVEQEQLRQEFTNLGHPEAVIQKSGEDFFIRTKEMSAQERKQISEEMG
ncbi:MAG: protein translocase subunit SecF, partial [Chloroflexota bacterium]|nr:protein translocase subunit SecF [Chloroflexota bacterium]